MIFGINTTIDISKLFYVISRAVRRENTKYAFNLTFLKCIFEFMINAALPTSNNVHCKEHCVKVARLDFFGRYLPSLSINCVGMSKDMGKRLPQLYYIKMENSYDRSFIAIGVAMAT